MEDSVGEALVGPATGPGVSRWSLGATSKRLDGGCPPGFNNAAALLPGNRVWLPTSSSRQARWGGAARSSSEPPPPSCPGKICGGRFSDLGPCFARSTTPSGVLVPVAILRRDTTGGPGRPTSPLATRTCGELQEDRQEALFALLASRDDLPASWLSLETRCPPSPGWKVRFSRMGVGYRSEDVGRVAEVRG